MSKACQIFRGDFEEQLEKLFMNRNKEIDLNQFIEEVCGDGITGACKEKEPPKLPEFYIDGVLHEDIKVTYGNHPQ